MNTNYTNEDIIVGVVREITGKKVIIRMLNYTNQIVHFYKGKNYSGVIIGSYVGIKKGPYTVVGRVESEYAYDQHKDIFNQEFSKDRFTREVVVNVVGSFKNQEFITGMVAFPQVFNDVILLSSDDHRKILGSINSSNDHGPGGGPDKKKTKFIDVPKLPFGVTWPDGIEFNLRWYSLFNTHIAIFGNTGSGKSNTLTKLYSELFSLNENSEETKRDIILGGSQFLLLDFNGEYISDETIATDKKVYNLNTEKKEGEDKIEISKSQFWNTEMLSVLFGATEQTQQPFLKRVISFYFSDERDFNNYMSNNIALAFKNVYSVPNRNGLDLLKQVIEKVDLENSDVSTWIDKTLYNSTLSSFYSIEYIEEWDSGSNKYYFTPETNIINEEFNNIKTKLNDKNFNIENPLKALEIASLLNIIYELRLNTVQYDHVAPILHRITSRSYEFSKIFKIVENANPFTEKNLNIISLKNVNQDMKMLIPMIVAKITYDKNKNQNQKQTKIFNLIIDEAHNILSEKSSRESEKWKDYRLEVFEEIIKEGRKFGYFLTIVSQRPSDISSTIVSQVHNYFVHRLVNENDLKLLETTMTSLDKVSKESIPNLSPGQVICTGVSFKLPLIVKVDKLNEKVAPISESPELLKMWLKNPNED